jgi:endonuclease/exonuclease/phosphatase family metal-dependent hydrolase
VIAAESPDIVGLQESDSGRLTSGSHDGVRWLAHELDYHYTFGTPTSAGTYGVALLSRWPIVNERVVLLPVGNSQPYPALVAEVDAPSGTVPVVVAHFQVKIDGHKQPAEAERIIDLGDEYDRLIAVGDFNARPGNAEAYRILDDQFRNAWTAANGGSGGKTYSASDLRMRIDHIWLTNDWIVTDAHTAGTATASDHRAVVATLDAKTD